MLLTGVKTVKKMLGEGSGTYLTQFLKHVHLTKEKASQKVFNFEAISGKDETVRGRANLLGYSEYSNTHLVDRTRQSECSFFYDYRIFANRISTLLALHTTQVDLSGCHVIQL